MIFYIILCLLIYLETIYHLFCFGMTVITPVLLFSLCIVAAGIEAFILSFFKKKTGKKVMWLFLILDVLIYGVQLVYMRIFRQPLLLSAAIHTGVDAVTNYWKETLYAIFQAWLPIVLLVFPLLLIKIFQKKKKLVLRKRHWRSRLKFLVCSLIGLLVFLIALLMGKANVGFALEEYEDFSNPIAVFEKYGMISAVQRDLHVTFWGDNTKDEVLGLGDSAGTEPEQKEPQEQKPDQSPNILPIDFAALAEKEDRETVKALHRYVENKTPTRKNEYTGMFQGYNLIYLTAEGFAPYCVDETLTPTLYKLLHSGFQFENYYTPLWQTSTSDGEFANCTGLLPDSQFSFRRSAENAMPFVLPGFFKGEGVASLGYHNNSLSYYDRYRTHENLGYFFKAGSPGKLSEEKWSDHIFKMEHPKSWPQSDLEMMQATLSEYINKPRFHAYYMTVSGHLQYNFKDNAMSAKNRDAVADLPYSERPKAYIACNIELDKALEWLINELDKAGKLENTVICMGADHYPYGLEKWEIEELRGKPLEKKRDLYHNSLILWNSAMEPVVVEKPCSAVDILPTLLNLFGFSYDSRLYSGQDILSDSSPLVIFSDRSFLTEQLYYDAKAKKAESINGEEPDMEYIENMKKKVKESFIFSAGILDYDYYETLKNYQP